MSEALYGLLGGLGGAVIAGAVAYLGPIHVKNRELLQAREERDFTRSMKLLDKQISLEESRTAQDDERRTNVVERVVLIRRCAADWYDHLDQAIADVADGATLDLADFVLAKNVFRDALKTACYDALTVGIRVVSDIGSVPLAASTMLPDWGESSPASDDSSPVASPTPSASPSGAPPAVPAPSHEAPPAQGWRSLVLPDRQLNAARDAAMESGRGQRAIVNVLDEASRLVQRLIKTDPHSPQFRTALGNAQRSLLEVRRCRVELSRLLMQEVESLGALTVIDTRGTR
ncbi:hypothetical protein [Streptomyces sp. NPDC050121]|uniref:hypothetical protein n=1 Tax=Streptomyces sp. NPDC050121 TaxID=3365601 RepID=UPI00379243EA